MQNLAFLRLHGVDAKNHPVFYELTRVKQYFEKLRSAEALGPAHKKALQLDQSAASRIVKHALVHTLVKTQSPRLTRIRLAIHIMILSRTRGYLEKILRLNWALELLERENLITLKELILMICDIPRSLHCPI